MKKVILFLCFGFYAFPEEAKLSFFIGDVFVKKKDEVDFKKASLNMVIEEGDQIRTGEDSRAEIRREEDVIKIDSNTMFDVVFMSHKKDLFKVIFGKVWFRLKRLKEKEASVETPTCVMGLRGTIFSVFVFRNETIIDLFKGKLEVLAEERKYILKDGERLRHSPDKPKRERIERKKLEAWEIKEFEDIFKLPEEAVIMPAPTQLVALPLEVKKPGLFEKLKEGMRPGEDVGLKAEIRDIRNEIREERQVINIVKARDFSAGRSMKDVWGNLLRVEQHLYRPDNSSIRFININRRETTEEDTSQFSYAMIDAKFNKELPDDISKWPEWIAQEIDEGVKSELHPERFEIILSNGRPGDDCDKIKWESIWKETKLSEPTFWIDKGGDNNKLYEQFSNDWKSTYSCEDRNKFYRYENFNIYKNKTDLNPAGSLRLSSWIINNDGEIMRDDDFKKMDFFDALNKTGCEIRIEPIGEKQLISKPIDIVFTADIVASVIKGLFGKVIGKIIE